MKRLTPASLTFGVMAIMGLLVAAYVVRSLMAREQKTVAVSTRNMPTPVVDLPIGTEITEKHLGTAPIRTDELSPDMLANKNIIIGRVVREPLKKAQPIRANQLFAPGERPKLEMAKGMQALTLPFDGVTTIVDGLIRPGDHCDIRFTLNPAWIRSDLRTSQAFQLTLFKAVKVLAINRNVVQQQPETITNTVTLEVSSKQANALLLSRSYGTLNLTYTEDLTPGGVEIADADAERLNLEKLLGLPEKKEPAAPTPIVPYRIDQYRALRRGVISFYSNGRIVDGTGWGGWGNGVDSTNSNSARDPSAGVPDDVGGPNLGAPDIRGSNNNGGGNNGNQDNRGRGNGLNASHGDAAPPTQMAAQSQYAHPPMSNSGVFNNSPYGPSSQDAAQQANAPQFFGQSAPGQVTGPGYSLPAGNAPGVYGNVP